MGYCNNYSFFSFIGLPGCGKSTLGSLLALKYKLEYFETSFLIDKAIAEAKEKSKMIFEKMDYEAEKQERRKKRGENCENEFVCKQVFERLISYSDGTVISGFPRDEEQAEKFYRITAEVSELPIMISDKTGVDISEIKAKISRIKRKAKIDILYIDYLQLLDTDDKERNYNREQQVSKISRGIKLLAKDYNMPIVVLAQLNRVSEQIADKKPKLHNLRESGSLEQDADGVIFLHRDWMSGIKENADGNSTEREADIIIAKWRDGEITEYKIGFDGTKMKFFEFEENNSTQFPKPPTDNPF